MMSTSPASIANDSTAALCVRQLCCCQPWLVVWWYTSLYRTIFNFSLLLLRKAAISSWSRASALNHKNANHSSSCNQETHCKTIHWCNPCLGQWIHFRMFHLLIILCVCVCVPQRTGCVCDTGGIIQTWADYLLRDVQTYQHPSSPAKWLNDTRWEPLQFF